MPAYAVGLLEGGLRRPRPAPACVVLGAAYRGGVKETAFSGVFAAVEALERARRRPRWSTTRCTPTRSSQKLGFQPYHLGEPVDAAVVQADHAEYRTLGPQDLPGVRVFIDGRRVSSPEAWDGVEYRVIGKA